VIIERMMQFRRHYETLAAAEKQPRTGRTEKWASQKGKQI
jgi:hypothetical protein